MKIKIALASGDFRDAAAGHEAENIARLIGSIGNAMAQAEGVSPKSKAFSDALMKASLLASKLKGGIRTAPAKTRTAFARALDRSHMLAVFVKNNRSDITASLLNAAASCYAPAVKASKKIDAADYAKVADAIYCAGALAALAALSEYHDQQVAKKQVSQAIAKLFVSAASKKRIPANVIEWLKSE